MLGMPAVVIFPGVGMLLDRRNGVSTHRVYLLEMPAIVLVICSGFVVGAVPGGDVIVQEALGWLGRVLRPVYMG